MPLRSGSLDTQITIQSATEAQDAFGEPIKTWANLATDPTPWAEKIPLSGSERFQAQQVNAEVDTTFRIRYRTDLDEEMRIVLDSTPYDIQGFIELGRREGLDVLTTARIQETV